jgi:hypothetical protein
MPYNDCNECPHYKKNSCPLSNFSQKQRDRFCPSLKLRIVDYNDSHVDLMAQKLLARIDAISKMYSPQQEMDYNRDDTGDIAERFDPNLN